jgi:hypothetical protein
MESIMETDTTQQQSALKVSVQEVDMAGLARKAMWIRWSDGDSGEVRDLSAYDVNLLLENGRVVQLAHGLPSSTHELVSAVEAPGKARIQVVGVRADGQEMEQGLTSWLEPAARAVEPSKAQEALLVGAGAPVIYSVQPSTLRAGTNRVTIQGRNLPVVFAYTITNLEGQAVAGTGTGFPSGTSSSVSLDIFVSASVPPGLYQIRVSTQTGSASAPISIATQSLPPVIDYLDPSLIYPDNSGPNRQMIVGGNNLPTSVSGFSVSSPLIGLSLIFPNPNSAVLYLSNLQSVPSGRYSLTARNSAGSATAYFDIVRFF